MEKTALLTDIHANLEALQACIRHAEERDVKRFVFMGDLVGYGADPAAVLNTVMRFAAEGHAVLLGNHGEAVLSVPRFFNEVAREAVLWTQRQLLEMHLNFLRSLPLFVSPDEDVFISHSGAWEPEKWHYVDDEDAAARAFKARPNATYMFCGHVHKSRLYYTLPEGKVQKFNPVAGSVIPLMGGLAKGYTRRWMATVGAVGQPRDGSCAAEYAIFDYARKELTFHRVDYDYVSAARKIIDAGLPSFLAERLTKGI